MSIEQINLELQFNKKAYDLRDRYKDEIDEMSAKWDEFANAMGAFIGDLSKYGPHYQFEQAGSELVELAARLRNTLLMLNDYGSFIMPDEETCPPDLPSLDLV